MGGSDPGSRIKARAARPQPGRENGIAAIIFACVLIVIIAMFGMAIDLGRVYNRHVELQTVADAAALAGARQLNGTKAGIIAAGTKAGTAAEQLLYDYNVSQVSWSSDAIKFGTSPDRDGDWMDATAAQAVADKIFYVKVDTADLDAAHGQVMSVFMEIVSTATASTPVSASSVAGRAKLNVTPFAICALDQQPATARAIVGPPAGTELVEFGFRRGVPYNLMRLGPGLSPQNFIVDPVDKLGAVGSASNTSASVVAPFICTGSIHATGLTGKQVTVNSPFPLDLLYKYFNTRFDQYSGTSCDPASAPPDANVKAYVYNSAVGWMAAPGQQFALESSADGDLRTVADPNPAPDKTKAGDFGPLWSYAKAAQYSSYVPGAAEPAGGYSTFAATSWGSLYKPGQPVATAYSSIPYSATSGTNFQAPSAANKPGIRDRRVLNVPLLACPVGSGTTIATVLGIGKFFMTVPATSTVLVGEFAGVASEPNLVGTTELFK